MNRNYETLTILYYGLLGVSLIFLFIHNVTNNQFWILGIPLWITVITYILFLVVKIITWYKYDHLMSDNPIKKMNHNYEFFDKAGFGLFTGGIVTLVTTDEFETSCGLIVIGFTCLIISSINKKRLEKFQESISTAHSMNLYCISKKK